MKIQNRQQLLAVFAIAVVGIYAGDKLLFTPLMRSWDNRAKNIATLRQQITQGNLLLQRERGITNHWAEMRGNTLSNSTSVAEQQLLKVLDTSSRESRISVTSVTPQWKRDNDDYMTLECRVEAACDLSTITRFLYTLEKHPLALKLERVELNSRDNEGQQIALGLQVSGLVLNPPPR